MSFGFLSGKHPVGLADRGRRLIRWNPGIDPLRPGAESIRDDGLDRDRLKERVRV